MCGWGKEEENATSESLSYWWTRLVGIQEENVFSVIFLSLLAFYFTLYSFSACFYMLHYTAIGYRLIRFLLTRIDEKSEESAL